MNKVWLFSFHFLLAFLPLFSQIDQQQIDSLTKITKGSSHDTIKFLALSDLNWIYSTADPNKARSIGYDEIQLAAKLKPIFKAQAYNDIAIAFYKLSMFDSSLAYNKKALEIRKTLNRIDLVGSSIAKMGAVYTESGDLKNALNTTLEALSIFEKLGDKPKMALLYNNVSQLYEKFNQLDMVKGYAEKSLKMCNEVGDAYGAANAKTALASYYIKHNQSDLAFSLLNEVIKTYYQYGDTLAVAAVYNNLGYMNRLIGRNKEGKDFYLKAIELAKKTGDVQGALMYKHNLSNIMMQDGDYKEAEKLSEDVLKFISPDNFQQLLLSYRLMANIKAYLGKGRESEEYQDRFVTLKDSLFSGENATAMAHLQTVYETEKQSLQIQNLEKDKELQSIEITKRNQAIIAITIGLALLIVLMIVVLKSYRQNQRAKELITQQKQHAELQRDKLHVQNVIIEEKKKEILDSINYARRIQEAILPPDEDIKKGFPECFVYYQPKDIVAGDFYWMYEEESLEEENISSSFNPVLLAAADCTGHGVPGAFMSLLGKENLDKSLTVSVSPSGILGELNRNIKRALKQNSKEDATRDGMDIALIKKQGNKIWYSGANRPLWIKRKNSETIEEIRATKTAIGGFTPDNQMFEEHEFEFEKGDMLYLFTDGYADQFGGEKQKKLTTKRLKEIFIQIANLPTEKQKNYLKNFMDDWKNQTEQVDDILVIGVRV